MLTGIRKVVSPWDLFSRAAEVPPGPHSVWTRRSFQVPRLASAVSGCNPCLSYLFVSPLGINGGDCDRQYPCNHCTRRRRPEECVYGSPPVNGPSRPSLPADQPETQPPQPVGSARPMRETAVDDSEAHWSREHSALARSFGYFEDSNSNTMALLRQ
ncbi:hypothetical protein PENSOL_c063G05503, partial [Penicillium solitum]